MGFIYKVTKAIGFFAFLMLTIGAVQGMGMGKGKFPDKPPFAVSQDIAGRTYCLSRITTLLQGNETAETTFDRVTVESIETAFDLTTGFTFDKVSVNQAFRINNTAEVGWDDLAEDLEAGTYIQTGSQLTLTLENDAVVNVYVSADGSHIQGHHIGGVVAGPQKVAAIIEYSFMEIDSDSGAVCAADPAIEL